MPAYDPDLLDYVFWARNVKGLAPTTIRVRLDFLLGQTGGRRLTYKPLTE